MITWPEEGCDGGFCCYCVLCTVFRLLFLFFDPLFLYYLGISPLPSRSHSPQLTTGSAHAGLEGEERGVWMNKGLDGIKPATRWTMIRRRRKSIVSICLGEGRQRKKGRRRANQTPHLLFVAVFCTRPVYMRESISYTTRCFLSTRHVCYVRW